MQGSTCVTILHLDSPLSDALILKHLHPCPYLDSRKTGESHQGPPTNEEGPWQLVSPGRFEHRAVKPTYMNFEPVTLLFPRSSLTQVPRHLRLCHNLPCSHLSISQNGLFTQFSKQQRISTFNTTSVPEHPDPQVDPLSGEKNRLRQPRKVGLEGEELSRLSVGEGHTPQPSAPWRAVIFHQS